MESATKNTGEQSRRILFIIWEIAKPFAIYYLLHSAVFLLIVFVCRAVAESQGSEALAYLEAHTETVTGLVSGIAMLLAVLPLIPMLRKELAEHKICGRGTEHGPSGKTDVRRKKPAAFMVCITVVLAAASSMGLNILFILTGLVYSSSSYQEVAQQQYGVVFGVGIILYGLVSPITEEIIFRGLIFNRMRRYVPSAMAVVVSGLLFGIYHGNPVQGIYGGCMGILMAYLYERTDHFVIPCLFHGTANLMVYLAAQNRVLYGVIFNWTGCVALFAVSMVCIGMVERVESETGHFSH